MTIMHGTTPKKTGQGRPDGTDAMDITDATRPDQARQDRKGRAGQDRPGRDRTGKAGQDRTGQGRTDGPGWKGLDRTGPSKNYIRVTHMNVVKAFNL